MKIWFDFDFLETSCTHLRRDGKLHGLCNFTDICGRITQLAHQIEKNQIFIILAVSIPEACIEQRDPSPRLNAWTTQLRRNIAAVARRWRRCARFDRPEIEPKTSHTDRDVPSNRANRSVNL